MWRMNLLRAIATGGLAVVVVSGNETLAALYLLSFVFGCAEVFFDNASQTLLPSIVESNDLEKANGRLATFEIVGDQFVGPPLGGLLFAAAASVPIFFDASTFAVSALLVFFIGGSFKPPQRNTRLGADIAEGLRWLWRHRLIRTLALLLGLAKSGLDDGVSVLVLFAQDILGVGAIGFGLLSIALAVGSAVAGLIAARVIGAIGAATSLMVAFFAFGATDLAMGVTSNPWLFAAISVLLGFFSVIWNVVTVSLRRRLIPDELLGRVNSVYRFVGWGAIPIGAALGGLTASLWGLRAPFIIGGVMQLVAIAVTAKSLIALASDNEPAS